MNEQPISRSSKLGSLLILRQQGFLPSSVIDVGALDGTIHLYQAFPEAHHLLIEPIAEYLPKLQDICASLPHAEYVEGAASDETRPGEIAIFPSMIQSALVTSESVRNETLSYRPINFWRVDDLIKERDLEGPILVKIDVDGEEVRIIRGCEHALSKIEGFIVEVTILDQIHDVIAQLKEYGFVIHDIIEPLYRPKDQFLWQVDMVFLREESPFRSYRGYE